MANQLDELNPEIREEGLDTNVIAKKIKSAVTDSEGVIEYRPDDEAKAGINNLLTIMAAMTNSTPEAVAKEFEGQGYGTFKGAVADAVVEAIRPIREEYDRIIKDKAYLQDICKNGAENSHRIAQRTLKKVYKKVGFIVD
mgnify:CR=1 FL=1